MINPHRPLTQDEADALHLDGRDGHGTYTLGDLNLPQLARLWGWMEKESTNTPVHDILDVRDTYIERRYHR